MSRLLLTHIWATAKGFSRNQTPLITLPRNGLVPVVSYKSRRVIPINHLSIRKLHSSGGGEGDKPHGKNNENKTVGSTEEASSKASNERGKEDDSEDKYVAITNSATNPSSLALSSGENAVQASDKSVPPSNGGGAGSSSSSQSAPNTPGAPVNKPPGEMWPESSQVEVISEDTLYLPGFIELSGNVSRRDGTFYGYFVNKSSWEAKAAKERSEKNTTAKQQKLETKTLDGAQSADPHASGTPPTNTATGVQQSGAAEATTDEPKSLSELPFHKVGVLAYAEKSITGTKVSGSCRIVIESIVSSSPFVAKIAPFPTLPYDSDDPDIVAKVQKIKEAMYKGIENPTPQYLNFLEQLAKINDPVMIVDNIMCLYTVLRREECLEILQSPSLKRRLELALFVAETEKNVRLSQVKLTLSLGDKTTKEEREQFLKEQLKLIRKELGVEADEREVALAKYRERLSACKVPKDIEKVIEGEMSKLQTLDAMSSEYSVTRNYLDWLTSIPWGITSKEIFDLQAARKVLDEDHYGLKDVKNRILEFIAVGAIRGSVRGKIILLVGPPGVGKTSVGRSIARALGRKFYRFSVGGLVDTAEIKGHRRTYVGSIPGKLIHSLKKVATSNPVVLIDELDKLGRGHQGDPAAALLEVLDPEQNKNFVDHYMDVPVDLSNILFVCTANEKHSIPTPLLDRMEVVKLSGYIPDEQFAIVKQFLIPAARKEAGLQLHHIEFEDSAIHELVRSYCRDPGVRNLQQHVEKVMRKVALKRVRGSKSKIKVTAQSLVGYVGQVTYISHKFYPDTPPGVAMGLAYNGYGGKALYIETVVDPQGRRPELRYTGQLGSSMRESTTIAHTYAKNLVAVIAPDNHFFESAAVHLHCPDGATKKDGPSAGIAMVTSLVSLALNTPVRKNFAMTGEITVTGKVLAIGGLQEKTIGAQRVGVTTLVLPLDNKETWEALPVHVRKGIEVHFADYYADVFVIAFPALSHMLTTAQPEVKTTATKKKKKISEAR